jgi:hypothetical protein
MLVNVKIDVADGSIDFARFVVSAIPAGKLRKRTPETALNARRGL